MTRALTLAALLATSACAAPAAPSPAASAAAGAVTVRGFAFSPATLEVQVGAKVTWTNQDPTNHTLTSGTPEKPDATFDMALDRGTSMSFTFQRSGTFSYFCAIHNSMRGQVVVR